MAVIRGPMLSFGASGQFAKTMVMSKWKGRPYARSYVIPSHPPSDSRDLTTNLFKWLQAVYKTIPTNVTAAFDAAASGQVLTGRNLFAKVNLPVLRGTLSVPVTSVEGINFCPGARAGFPLLSAVPTDASGQSSILITPPSGGAIWPVKGVFAYIIDDQDPHSGLLYTVYGGTEALPADPVVITGLTNTHHYFGSAWATYTKPDGSIAYSPATAIECSPHV